MFFFLPLSFLEVAVNVLVVCTCFGSHLEDCDWSDESKVKMAFIIYKRVGDTTVSDQGKIKNCVEISACF